MRGKPWSVDEERQLRRLVEDGQSLDEISRIMGKTRVSVKGKLFNSGLNSVKVATGVPCSVAAATTATTTPAKPTAIPSSAPEPASISDPVTVASVNPVYVGLKLPERLPSIEEELKILSAAVEALTHPGLSRAEASRLRNIIQGVKVYQELFAKFVDYRGLEAEVLELRRKLAAENEKSSSK